MRRVLSLIAVALYLSSAPLAAQLALGDIGVTWLSNNQFTVLRTNGSSTVFNVGSFLGTGTTATIVQSPEFPNAFLIGGGGFIGRATITGPNSVAYSLITNAVSLPAQMSFDGRELVVMDFGTDQVVRVDLISGATTNLTTGPQPWGTDLNAGVLDPATGRIFAGGNNGIWMIPPGGTTATSYASGWVPPSASSYVTGIAIDPITFDPVATLLTVNRVVRINSNGTLTDLVPAGSIPGPNAIELSTTGDFIVGASFGQIYRVPRAGGTALLLGTATGVIGAATGVAPIRTSFEAFLTPTGNGAAVLSITGIPANTIEGWTLPTLDTSLPPNTGPILGITPDPLTFLFINTFPTAIPGSFPHWAFPVASPLFPATSQPFASLTFPPNLTLDIIAIAITPSSTFTATAPRRILIL